MQIHALQFMSKEKDLGIIFNPGLSFDAHINDKVSNLDKILGLIRRTFAILNEVTPVQLCRAFV